MAASVACVNAVSTGWCDCQEPRAGCDQAVGGRLRSRGTGWRGGGSFSGRGATGVLGAGERERGVVGGGERLEVREAVGEAHDQAAGAAHDPAGDAEQQVP